MRDAVPEMGPPRVAGWIDGAKRIVPDVAVAVVALQVAWGLDERIRGHEPSEERVVDPAVHVNERKLIQMLMRGEATVGRDPKERVARIARAVALAALPVAFIG